jgi:hypothetical protein
MRGLSNTAIMRLRRRDGERQRGKVSREREQQQQSGDQAMHAF